MLFGRATERGRIRCVLWRILAGWSKGQPRHSSGQKKPFFFPHPCATCAPFAILVAKEVLTRLHGRANVDIVFLRTNSHGATVLIDTDGSHCLIDSSLGTAHVLEENKWFYKTNKTQNAIVAASPPRLPHNVSELVHCKSLRQILASTSHSSTSHGDISQPLKLRCFAKKSPKSSNFKEVSQEELLEWSLRDAIRQPSIVFLGRTQSNRQNVFTHYLKVDLQTAEVTPFQNFQIEPDRMSLWRWRVRRVSGKPSGFASGLSNVFYQRGL